MQYSVHSPTNFIRTHLSQLLPSWTLPVLSMLIVLQQCQFVACERTVETEKYKNLLRQQFIEFGCTIVFKLREMGHLADMFDPRTGWPITSQPGETKLDDVAVASSALGYAINCGSPCRMIVHPTWGGAVYPSTLVSSAAPQVLQDVVASVIHNMYNTSQMLPTFSTSENSTSFPYSLSNKSFPDSSQNTTTAA